jgi:hypothetical protein
MLKLTAPAPTYPQSPADKAAHLAAVGPVRGQSTDSDPDIDEALRRARGDSDIAAALHRLQTEVAYIERDAQLAADVAKDLAAADEDDPRANWIPNVAPETEDMWDVACDAYGTRVWPMTLRSAA